MCEVIDRIMDGQTRTFNIVDSTYMDVQVNIPARNSTLDPHPSLSSIPDNSSIPPNVKSIEFLSDQTLPLSRV